MKILAIVSALDLRLPYSCTPAWWQLLKAMSEIGVDIVATPYAGRELETPWWRAYQNPCLAEAEGVRRAKVAAKRVFSVRGSRTARAGGSNEESTSDKLMRELAQRWTLPKWERHVTRILEKERNVDAVLIMTVPPNQLVGLARRITGRFGIPFYYYDGDIPASLPSFAGFDSGFRIYHGSDPSEYEAFISNSKGGEALLLELGARKVHTLYYGVDPAMFAPVDVDQDIDVFFYGHGAEYRETWIEAMIAQPSRDLPDARFALRGTGFERVDLGNAVQLPYLSVGNLREYCGRSRLNLLVNRLAHATVYGSSSCRPFELAAMRTCMVSSPYLGIEEWFEPEREVFVISEPQEALDRIQWLLGRPQARAAAANAAYQRALAEHTYARRARQLVEMLGLKPRMRHLAANRNTQGQGAA